MDQQGKAAERVFEALVETLLKGSLTPIEWEDKPLYDKVPQRLPLKDKWSGLQS